MAATDINYSRQLEIFKPLAFTKSVDVIGAGSVGSHIVYLLAKLGVGRIRVYDFDTVSDHNIPNQLFGTKDVGRLKVDALKEIVRERSGIEISTYSQRVEKGCGYVPSSYVFLLIDTMSSRKEVWADFLRMNINVDLVIETRIGASSARLYAVKPFDKRQAEEWEKTLYDDDEAETSLCGSNITIIPTAVNVASLAVWQFLNHVNGKPFQNEIIYGLEPLMVAVERNFV